MIDAFAPSFSVDESERRRMLAAPQGE